jgi:hypothetical protein
MKPIYALRRQDENDRFLRTLERQVRDRVVAGRMAIGFLKEALTGEVPPGIKRVSINELAQLVLNDVGYTEPENDQKNLASPSDRHRAIRARSEVTNCSEHSGPNANSPNDPASGANANPTRSLGASSLIG